ncbi:MAG: cell division protein ZipA C-terminal FtsZ-binding domain-containing protein [Candidatus Competibacterales bacterium]|nr:cell division protein ZipA C-terminal FtsZ-binding domain-containing protein [Candidatus Competibacterales bacterium]
MDELRLMLLGIGVVVIALIYLWGMRRRIRERLNRPRREPALDDEPAPEAPPEPDVWEPEVRIVSGKRRRSAAPAPEALPESRSTETVKVPMPEDEDETPARSVRRSGAPASEDEDEAARLNILRARSVEPQYPTYEDEPAPQPVIEPEPEEEDEQSITAELEMPPDAAPEVEARIGDEAVAPERELAAESEDATPSEQPAEEMMVALTILHPEGRRLKGSLIGAAARSQGLVLGERGLWECLTGDGTERLVFSMAHLRQPGTFDPDTLDQLETPGLLLFMKLPGPMDAVPAVDLLLECAGRIARRLGANLCDERRERLSPQAMLQLRDRAADFDQRQPALSADA